LIHIKPASKKIGNDAAALGFAVPATALALSDGEAQTSGMERRGERREGRRERRDTQRGGGQETTGTGYWHKVVRT